MNPSDPLENLLKSWTPQSPQDPPSFTRETMAHIRSLKKEPFLRKTLRIFDELSEDWLPSPGVLVPIAALLVLFVAVHQSQRGIENAKAVAALEWHEELSNPLAKTTLTGAYHQNSTSTK